MGLWLFPACDGLVTPEQGEGTVLIRLPGKAASRTVEDRAAIPDQVISAMVYTITCTGPTGTKTVRAEGGGTITIGLAAGSWHIAVDAHYGDLLAGRGDGDVEVREGAANSVDIKMTPTSEFAAPLIISGPRETTAIRYTAALLEVEAMTFLQGGLLYQWYRSDSGSNAGGVSIPGAEGAAYAPPTGTLGTVYYYVVVRGADGLTTVSGAAAVTVVNPEALILSNGKAAEGGAYGINEPFRHRVMAVAGGETRDISASLGPGDFNYNFSSEGTKTVSLSPSSSLSGVPCSSVSVTVKTIADRVTWANGQGGAHTLLLYANESMPGVTTANITTAVITIKSNDESAAGMRTLQLTGTGSLFIISTGGGKLTLGRNITLQGIAGNNSALVRVFYDAVLVMEEGSAITGNENTAGNGGGVSMTSDSTFTMNGGIIGGDTPAKKNTAVSGGGVYVYGSDARFVMGDFASVRNNTTTGTSSSCGGGVYVGGSGSQFTMGDNASVSDNTATATGTRDAEGGGVYVGISAGFTMSGSAFVSDNTATATGTGKAYGGGVYVDGGAFSMSGSAFVSDNTATGTGGGDAYGGGVYMGSTGNFIMNGGTISGNMATVTGGGNALGGGVYMGSTGDFIMDGGTISGNQVTGIGTSSGGGVYVGGGTFAMNSGSISTNVANTNGGGVIVISGDFTMNSGVIGGNTAWRGGGVYMGGTGDFDMNGGSISGNQATGTAGTDGGGGVYIVGGTFTLTHGTVYGTDAATELQNMAVGNGDAVYNSGGSCPPPISVPANSYTDNTVSVP